MNADWFVCSKCGKTFEDWAFPANVHQDDKEPLCPQCIDTLLDSVPPVPLSEEQIQRIVMKVLDTD